MAGVGADSGCPPLRRARWVAGLHAVPDLGTSAAEAVGAASLSPSGEMPGTGISELGA